MGFLLFYVGLDLIESDKYQVEGKRDRELVIIFI